MSPPHHSRLTSCSQGRRRGDASTSSPRTAPRALAVQRGVKQRQRSSSSTVATRAVSGIRSRIASAITTDLKVTILHDQAKSGRTILEKFERDAATAAFAVAIFTGDDVRGPQATRYHRRPHGSLGWGPPAAYAASLTTNKSEKPARLS